MSTIYEIYFLQNPVQRPISATNADKQRNAAPRLGRKPVSGSNKNVSSSGSPKQQLGSYAQSYSVINQSALQAINVGGPKRWWCRQLYQIQFNSLIDKQVSF